jgi:hypothetical protein
MSSSSDYGEGHECREKVSDNQVMEWMSGDQNHVNFTWIARSILCCYPSCSIRYAWCSGVSECSYLLIEIQYFPYMSTTSGHIHSDQYPTKEELCAPCLSGDISRHDMESCSCVMEKSVDTCVQGKGVRLTWYSTCLSSVNSSSMPSTIQTH